MCFIAIILVAPAINLTAYVIMWKTSGPEFSLITLAWWIVMMFAQHYTTEKTKVLKTKESQYNDER
jgi:uncharacterized membrane-anchored protein YitT (DUF2179 family)